MADVIEVTGMVISSMPVNDYDKRVVILTKERGKISAFARGARRMNSPLMGGTNAMCLGRFTVYEGRTSYNIQQTAIDSYFQEVANDIDSVYYAFYFMELADYYSVENVDASEMVNLLYMTFRALTKNRVGKELIRYIFELRAMVISGTYPNVFECNKCRQKENLHVFSAAKGGVYCDGCRRDIYDGITMSPSTLYTLQYIIGSPVEKLFSFEVKEAVLIELRLIMGRLNLLYVDRKLKSLEILESMNF